MSKAPNTSGKWLRTALLSGAVAAGQIYDLSTAAEAPRPGADADAVFFAGFGADRLRRFAAHVGDAKMTARDASLPRSAGDRA